MYFPTNVTLQGSKQPSGFMNKYYSLFQSIQSSKNRLIGNIEYKEVTFNSFDRNERDKSTSDRLAIKSERDLSWNLLAHLNLHTSNLLLKVIKRIMWSQMPLCRSLLHCGRTDGGPIMNGFTLGLWNPWLWNWNCDKL